MMNNSKTYLQRNKIAIETVARQLQISKKYVQQLITNLLSHAQENNFIITAESCEAWALAHTDSIAYQILDWDGTLENRIALLTGLLNNLSFLISPDNIIYTIKN